MWLTFFTILVIDWFDTIFVVIYLSLGFFLLSKRNIVVFFFFASALRVMSWFKLQTKKEQFYIVTRYKPKLNMFSHTYIIFKKLNINN
jgi:hypothetical protein